MTCLLCNTHPCSCEKLLETFISQLRALETSNQPIKTHELLGFLPQNTFARLIYVFLGGYDNPILATIGTCTTTHILFHYLTPRFIGRYVLAYPYLQNDDWFMPGLGDLITTVLWSVLILLKLNEKSIEQKTTIAIIKSANKKREELFDDITKLLNNIELDEQFKKSALITISTINKHYRIIETEDHLISIKYSTPNKISFWERYNNLNPSIYYKTYDYLCNKASQTFNQLFTDTGKPTVRH